MNRRRRAPATDPAGVAVRRLALDILQRIDEHGAYANLATRAALDRVGDAVAARDRAFVTDLVYGTTRMRRACDFLVDRHRRGDVTPRVRAALRLGAYQLAFGGVAAHAAVSTTVGAAPKPARGLVNAVLRRVADDVSSGDDELDWPDRATRTSYPDWIVAELERRLGADAAAVLDHMNLPATTHVRDDGYVQDAASQAVVAAVEAEPGHLVVDACAAPGGKATALAGLGARVVAADLAAGRVGLLAANRDRLGLGTGTVALAVADATAPPLRPGAADRVLLDAPCSGLGVLRRRPDARWRIDAGAPTRLAALQVRMIEAQATLLGAGGLLVYSVCTLTEAENSGVVAAVDLDRAGLDLVDETTIVPDETRDGMYIARFRRRGAPTPPSGGSAGPAA